MLIIAHRGASAANPENTLPAFVAALHAGADLVELDYRHSADGVPVVIHDETLDRTTNAREIFGGKNIPVTGKSLAELQRLDAGRWFAGKFTGTPLPTLSAALDVIQRRAKTLIERKAGDAATCVRLLRTKRLLRSVVVQSFDWDFLRECRRLAPRLRLAALGDKKLTPRRLDEAATIGADVIAWNHQYIGRDEVSTVHDRGWQLWVWTVNRVSQARRLRALGVDGLITDRPALLKRPDAD